MTASTKAWAANRFVRLKSMTSAVSPICSRRSKATVAPIMASQRKHIEASSSTQTKGRWNMNLETTPTASTTISISTRALATGATEAWIIRSSFVSLSVGARLIGIFPANQKVIKGWDLTPNDWCRFRSVGLFQHSNRQRSSFRVLRDVPVVKLDSVPDDHTIEPSEVVESLFQVGNPVWLPADVRMHGNRHHFHAFAALFIELIE